jgi:hypothetical protein
MFFMMRSTICSTQGFSQPARRTGQQQQQPEPSGGAPGPCGSAARGRASEACESAARSLGQRRLQGRRWRPPRLISSFCTRSMLMGSL